MLSHDFVYLCARSGSEDPLEVASEKEVELLDANQVWFAKEGYRFSVDLNQDDEVEVRPKNSTGVKAVLWIRNKN